MVHRELQNEARFSVNKWTLPSDGHGDNQATNDEKHANDSFLGRNIPTYVLE